MRAQTPNYKRFALLQDLQGLLYDKPNQLLVSQLNAVIAATKESAFLYKGKVYGTRGRTAVKPLTDPGLCERVEDLLRQDRALESEKVYVNAYINAILSASTYPSTYVQMLPTLAHDLVRKHFPDIGNETHSDERIAEILKYCQEGERLFKKRILKNTVME